MKKTLYNNLIQRIQKHILPHQELKVTVNNRFLILDKQSGTTELFGCLLCAMKEISQDEMGNPQIDNHPLLSANNIPELKNLDSVIKSNLWFCPECHRTITQLLPKFII